jgi:uncharacterized protein YndB with AHSA1/START domain
MKRIVVGVLVLIAFAAVIVLVGFALPRDHTAASTIRLSVPTDSVWPVVRDMARYPEWWGSVRRMESVPSGPNREVWRQTDRNGTMPFEVVREEPGSVLVTRILDEGLPFGGTWTYEVRPEAGGTLVRVTEDGSVYNPVFRFLSRFVFGHYATMDDYLAALGGRFGDNASPVHVQ